MTIQFVRRFVTSQAIALVIGALVAGPALATVGLRVEARPISDPIQVFVTVTDANGPVPNLPASDFTITLDGGVPFQPTGVTLPPAQDPTQKVSVVFVMDYSQSVVLVALPGMQEAVIAFINEMNVGDYAAIIKFNDTHPDRASVVLGFTEIDGAGNPGNQALETAVLGEYLGDGTNLLDAVNLALDQFITPPIPIVLPTGPKAIILVSDGGDNESEVTEDEVIALANANSIPLFAIGVGDLTLPGRAELMGDLGTQTGGEFIPAPNNVDIVDAYAAISVLLNNEYLISLPSTGIDDCLVHTMEVEVAGQAPPPASVEFTRRICDTEPNLFTFTNQTGVARGNPVISNTITITGLEIQATGFETPADISTQVGSYSIGCNGTFTGDPGTIINGQTVCVRHTASSASLTSRTTTLTIGGVAGTFTSTTTAAPPEGGGGGGGATGGIELLFGVLALIARRRRYI